MSIPAVRYRIDEVIISTRLFNCLCGEGYVYLDEVAHLSDDELFRIPNFGRETLHELRQACGQPRVYTFKWGFEKAIDPYFSYPRPVGKSPDIIKRNIKIAQMRKDRLTLQKIGDEYGISRERVRCILAKCWRVNRARTN